MQKSNTHVFYFMCSMAGVFVQATMNLDQQATWSQHTWIPIGIQSALWDSWSWQTPVPCVGGQHILAVVLKLNDQPATGLQCQSRLPKRNWPVGVTKGSHVHAQKPEKVRQHLQPHLLSISHLYLDAKAS